MSKTAPLGLADLAENATFRETAAGKSTAQVNEIELGEDGLGFDSLALIDLVGVLTAYFGLDESGVEDYMIVRPRIGDWAEIVARHFELVGTDAVITFSTSGSMGAPKQVQHMRAHLEDEVRVVLETVLAEKQHRGRILSGVAPRHVYGFIWGVLLPARGGMVALDVNRVAPSGVIRMARSGDVILGTPFTWEHLARVGRAFPRDVVGITSGAPSSPSTWEHSDRLGLSRMVEVYGSTETAGVGVRTSGSEPFRLLPTLRRQGDGIERIAAPGTRPEVQDKLDWQSPEDFYVLGRLDDVVQVAGTNVSPRHVCTVIRECPGISDAVVRLEGARLKANVILADPKADIGVLEGTLRQHIEAALPPAARPERLTFGTELPRNAMGKLCDW